MSAQTGSRNSERIKSLDRKVGLAADLPEEWIEAVRQAAVPNDFAYLNAELD